MRHGLPSPWVAGRTAYAGWPGVGMPAGEKCRNGERFGVGWPIGQLVHACVTAESERQGRRPDACLDPVRRHPK
ncbi:hypothetical protein F3J12_29890 [Burkholderia sp. Ax-1735]|nr:hypothetical protein [Burkholderia sp. Ap-955]NIF13651.1 hypothetical protein [Burkholderia sp. Ax-1735]NIG06819.1 hypothetical protein [Burkholderia sp. Tr-849]